jgi:(R,R)-butanediol dehydrogenase/meso-butanediol dehydrogenase/diacetyl reductase
VKAATTADTGEFEVVDVPDPAPGLGELLVRVAGCGVCGSDIKAHPFMPPGTVMGHELGGEVIAVGAGVDISLQGANVAVLPVISCGRCGYCSGGDVSHCTSARFIGMGNDAGGFAELAVVPAVHAFALPDELPGIYAALVEPFAVGLHSVNAAEVAASDSVLIVGAGGVGLTTAAWARVRGAARITVADPDPARRALARAMGATDVLESAADATNDGYDAVIECVGRPELLQMCESAARARGRIVIAGACETPMPVEPISALLKELTIRFSVAYQPNEFREVIAAFTSGAIDPTRIVGVTVGLDRLDDAFDLVRTGGVEGRVLVIPERTHNDAQQR